MSDVVNGYLEAMQAINDRPDHRYTFEFLKMKGARNAIDASKQHFGALCDGTLNEIDINGLIGKPHGIIYYGLELGVND
ncbi:hypothetical protein [Paenibacillus elgii]|uniref:hypothetical protein n=1 Tax=Paenibacillus elgii TaxID=189691 RepID=UPI0013D52BE5|nr:hypothetical protein [Paenibacillus elgii]